MGSLRCPSCGATIALQLGHSHVACWACRRKIVVLPGPNAGPSSTAIARSTSRMNGAPGSRPADAKTAGRTGRLNSTSTLLLVAGLTVAAFCLLAVFARSALQGPQSESKAADFSSTSQTDSDKEIAVGIAPERFRFVYASQRGSQWCWAACIEMLMNYYGVSLTQEDIVARSYGTTPDGELPDFAGSIAVVTTNLNHQSVDRSGKPYAVECAVTPGPPSTAHLVYELGRGLPVMCGYAAGPTAGHAVIITEAVYVDSPAGPIVTRIVVHDPSPGMGRVEYAGGEFAEVMTWTWTVRVAK